MTSTRYHVEWSEDAESDALRIVQDFDSDANARRVIDTFARKADGLALFPKRGRVVPELHRIGLDSFLEIMVSPWRLVYRIDGKRVYIIAVLDGRRDLDDVLYQRLVRP